MDFFSAQDEALRRSKRLIYLFILAIAAIVLGLYAVVASVFFFDDSGLTGFWDPVLFAWVALPVSAVILIASAVKINQYKKGGGVVAKALGGRWVDPATQDPKERRLINIVEEMAIASGMPVPEVYVLDNEPGVNAFAAGYNVHDAAVAVTQGALDQFSRDELQGVMAHEFSHILNGDMRLNIRTAGVIFGIFLLSVIGHGMIRGGMRAAFIRGGSRRGGKDNGAGAMLAIMALGIALYLLGLIGQLFGRLIQAAVSRQREFLADASAVQFTRNPDGIANALKRISQNASGGKVQTESAQGLAHFFFASALSSGRASLFATHPPLRKRILAIQPNWDGTPAPALRTVPDTGKEPLTGNAKPQGRAQQPLNQVFPGLHQAQLILAAMPPVVRAAGRSADRAYAVVCALLLCQTKEVRGLQLKLLQQSLSADRRQALADILPAMEHVAADQRLPAVELALPALHSLTVQEVDALLRLCRQLVDADEKVSAFEWCLLQMLRRHFKLRDPKSEQPHATLSTADKAAALHVLKVIFLLDPPPVELQSSVWKQALETLELDAESTLPTTDQVSFDANLESSMDTLAQAPAIYRKQFLQAAQTVIAANGTTTEEEAMLLKVLAFCLECPVAG